MFLIAYEDEISRRWSSDYIFENHIDAKNYLIEDGFSEINRTFERKDYNWSKYIKAYILPKKIYRNMKLMEVEKKSKDTEATSKYEGYKSLSLSPKKLKEISITPEVKDGKLLFDKENPHHRYIMEEHEELNELTKENRGLSNLTYEKLYGTPIERLEQSLKELLMMKNGQIPKMSFEEMMEKLEEESEEDKI